MALAPKFAGQRLTLSGSPAKALHTVELYLDYVCPFSAKQFNTLYNVFLPKVKAGGKPYADKVQFVFRQQIQPWHPSSTLVHEAAVAVLRLKPAAFWDFSARLFDRQKEYFDVSVVNEARNATYKRLAALGAEAGVDEAEMFKLLQVSDKPGDDGGLNVGNGVTDDLKLLIKAARITGVHVSPTVMFNGLMEPSISSSFSAEDWDKWLQEHCT